MWAPTGELHFETCITIAFWFNFYAYSIVQKKLSSWDIHVDTLRMQWKYPWYYLRTLFTLLCNCSRLIQTWEDEFVVVQLAGNCQWWIKIGIRTMQQWAQEVPTNTQEVEDSGRQYCRTIPMWYMSVQFNIHAFPSNQHLIDSTWLTAMINVRPIGVSRETAE